MTTWSGSLQFLIQMKINPFHFLTEGFLAVYMYHRNSQKASENARKVHTWHILPQQKALSVLAQNIQCKYFHLISAQLHKK